MTTLNDMGFNPKSVGVHRTFSPASYGSLLDFFYENGEIVSPNGVETRELIDATLVLRHPQDRIIYDRGRNMNIAFGIAEWISYVCGIDDLNYFKRYISTYDRFSTDGKILDGAYGTRIVFKDHNSRLPGIRKSQIDGVVSELRRDPYSRRAVISIFDRGDLYGGGGKNTPCTLSLQFFIRNEMLHAKTTMRSCDVVKGLTYDLFTFTMIQELVARQLDCELGFYLHGAGSFHLYQDDYGLSKKLENANWRHRMWPMPKLEHSHIETMRQVALCDTIFEFVDSLNRFPQEPEFDYMKNLLLVLRSFTIRNSDPKVSKMLYDGIQDKALRYVARPWLARAGVMDK